MTDPAQTSTATRDQIRQKLEQTHTGYHDLLKSLSAEDFKKKSANEAWTVGQLMWHVAWGSGYVASGVERARTGKDLSFPPRGIFDTLNPWVTRMGARGASPASVAKKYDEAYAKALAAIDTVKDDEWDKGFKRLGQFLSVTDVYGENAGHFEEHRADILKGLGR
ncbi:MAG: DinB family protein [Dehalococcoidia bacterium]